jgi:arylsulfatase A-like enzyme
MNTRPDFVTIICDQFNPNVLSLNGGPVHAPNIERLMTGGMRFDNAVCPYPVCTPSRIALVTGTYPHSHRNRGTLSELKPEHTTIDKLLHEDGYTCGYFGKWHMGENIMPYYKSHIFKYPRFFSMLRDIYGNEDKTGVYASYADEEKFTGKLRINPEFQAAAEKAIDKWQNDRLGKQYGYLVKYSGKVECELDWFMDHTATMQTVEFIKENTDSSFAVTCSIEYPHNPNILPSPYYEIFNRDEIKLPANYNNTPDYFTDDLSSMICRDLGPENVKELIAIYYGQVMLVDDLVGMLLKTLEETGRIDDTIIIFTADHGDMAGEHGMFWKSTKAFYDGTVKIPMCFYNKNIIKSGASDKMASLIDIMPTICELAGVTAPDNIHGISLVNTLTSQGTDLIRTETETGQGTDLIRTETDLTLTEYAYCERLSDYGEFDAFMIKSNAFKYFYYDEEGTEFLFDIKNDPYETTNLAADEQYGSIKNELKNNLKKWIRENG